MIKKVSPQRRILFLLLSALMLPGLGQAAPVRAAEADDVVFLKNGGRARGVVIESDPAKGTRVRLQDGTIRSFDSAAVDHVKYAGDAPTPQPSAAPPKSAPVAPATAPVELTQSPQPPAAGNAAATAWNAVLGSLRVESSEPGDVHIEGAEYGVTPAVVSNLSAGPHKILVRFHAGDDDSRLVHVRGGTETVVHFDGTAGLRAFRAHQGFHLGLGAELGFGLMDGDDAAPAFNVILRGNYAVSRLFECYADLRVGAFPTKPPNHSEEATPGAALRIGGQLHLGSVYTVSIGLDAGVGANSGVFGGGHISPIGFRMGSERSFLLAFILGARGNGRYGSADFLLGGTYLFN